ncbi:MAG: glutamine--fructose-6-phosphate transaminase (isomerizing) [Candidatus Omnitrophota bacterium]|nr:glutamine--fructose-6-phosphate transaminase (isomerizing) [Candidatus Omnitrophota bacterium]
MCGIIGYVGKDEAVPILIKGLTRLEYRGYDSAGVAVLDGNIMRRLKTAGKIKRLSDCLKKTSINGTLGIAHTRWATHGIPNNINAHPHYDCTGAIALVHNGIIENCDELKAQLKKEGHKFLSETDTEVLPHLIEKYYKGNLEAAVRRALKNAHGSYAIAVIHTNEPDKLVGAKCGSPLIVGVGKGENFLASDCPAILDKTRKVIFVEDREIIALTKDSIEISDLNGKRINRKPTAIEWDISQAEKGGFAHFMLKEIYEQPRVIHKILSARTNVRKGQVKVDGINLTPKQLLKFDNIIISACGTAYHAGLIGEYLIEKFARIPVEVDVSSEFRYRSPILDKRTLFIAVSQSGETADTLAALREAKKNGAKVVSICNVVGSTITRESDGVIYTYAGPEIGVASTKAYTAQVATFILLALYLGGIKGLLGRREMKNLLNEFEMIPEHMDEILDEAEAIKNCAKKYFKLSCFMYIARGVNFPNALEGALKLKEISYIHAEGYGAGEMKHGPIALIEENMAVVAIAPQAPTYEKMLSNIREIRAREGKIIAIVSEGDSSIKRHVSTTLYVPKTQEVLSPLLTVLPLQLLAYHVAVARGRDVDQPRNLAKSVTVE